MSALYRLLRVLGDLRAALGGVTMVCAVLLPCDDEGFASR